MSNTWKRAAVALLLGLSGVTLFAAAACASVATPVRLPTLHGMEVKEQVSPRVGRTDMPTPTTGPKATSEESREVTDQAVPKASETDMPSPTAGPKATPGKIRGNPSHGQHPEETLPNPSGEGTVPAAMTRRCPSRMRAS